MADTKNRIRILDGRVLLDLSKREAGVLITILNSVDGCRLGPRGVCDFILSFLEELNIDAVGEAIGIIDLDKH